MTWAGRLSACCITWLTYLVIRFKGHLLQLKRCRILRDDVWPGTKHPSPAASSSWSRQLIWWPVSVTCLTNTFVYWRIHMVSTTCSYHLVTHSIRGHTSFCTEVMSLRVRAMLCHWLFWACRWATPCCPVASWHMQGPIQWHKFDALSFIVSRAKPLDCWKALRHRWSWIHSLRALKLF